MSAPCPDDRLSAFYDGELSAVERLEIERLLAERSELRAELHGWTDLSQRMSQLADDLPEFDLRERVMSQLVSPLPRLVASPVRGAVRRRWMPLLLAASALTLLVAALFPLLPEADLSSTVAMNANTAPSVRMTDAFPHESMSVPMTMALPAPASTASDSPVSAMAMAMESVAGTNGALLVDPSAAADVAPGMNQDRVGQSEFLADLERRRDLKPGDIISRMIEAGDLPMLVDYTVVDVMRSAEHVEILLQENGILPLPAVGHDSANFKQSEKAGRSSQLKVYLLDAETESLNSTLLKCNDLAEVVALNVEPLTLPADNADLLASQNQPAPDEPAAAVATMDSVARRSGNSSEAEYAAPAAERGDTRTMQKQGADPLDTQRDHSPGNVSKMSKAVSGNSLVIENGEEVYAELQQLQSQQLRNGRMEFDRADVAPSKPESSQSLNVKKRAVVELLNRNNTVMQNRSFLQDKDQSLPFNNSVHLGNSGQGVRGRQRAILVLRPQSPPPPPEAIRVEP